MSARNQSPTTVEATVTSKGQVTLPKELRNRLGIQKGSKIRFSISDRVPVTVEPVLHDLEELWRMADQDTKSQGAKNQAAKSQGTKNQGAKPQPPMTFEEMNAAKSRREW